MSKQYRRDVEDIRGAVAVVTRVDTSSYAKQKTRQMKASMRRKHALKKAFIHICIQAIAIAPGCLIFLGVACSLAIESYGGTEQPRHGGTLYEQFFACAVLLVSWTTVVFDSVTLFAITFRTYESIIIAGLFTASKDGRRRKLAYLHPTSSILQNAGCASRDAEDEIGVESSYFETQSRQCPEPDVEQFLLQPDAIDPLCEQILDYNASTEIGQRSGKKKKTVTYPKETFEKPEKAVMKLSFVYDVEAQQLHRAEDETKDSLIFQ